MTGDEAPPTLGRRLRGLARWLRPDTGPTTNNQSTLGAKPESDVGSWGAVLLVGPRQGRHLSECLDSLSELTPRDVVVVPWGGGEVPDALAAGSTGRRTDQPRWRILDAVDRPGAARAAGLAALAPEVEYVVWIDASAVVDPRVLPARLRALALTPEASACGPDALTAQASDADARAEALDVRLGEWVFRRAALERGSTDVRSGRSRFGWRLVLDHVADAVRTPGMLQRHHDRLWATPFGTVPSTAPELADYVAGLADLADRALADLSDRHTGADPDNGADGDNQATADRAFADRALAGALATTAGVFLDDSEHADPDALAVWGKHLRAWLPRLADSEPVRPDREPARPDNEPDNEAPHTPHPAAPATLITAIPAGDRVRLWLLAQGRVGEMQQLTVDRWFQRPEVATSLVEGRIVGDFGVPDLPDEVGELPPRATRHLMGCATGDRTVVRVVAAIDWLDDRDHPAVHTAHLISPDGPGPIDLPVRRVPDPAATRFVGRSRQRHDDDLIEVDLTDVPLGRWRVEIESRVGDIWTRGPLTGREPRGGAGDLERLPGWSWSADGGLEIVRGKMPAPAPSEPPGLSVTDIKIDRDVTISGLVHTGTVDGLTMRLGEHALAAATTEATDGRFVATFTGLHDRWGVGPAALMTGTWHFTHRAGRREREVAVARELLDRLPLDLAPTDGPLAERPRWRGRALRGLRGQLLLRLTAPLSDAELGPWAQFGLRTAYAVSVAPIEEDLALFSSYAGTGATDSPRAICEELQRRRPDMTIRWAVADNSVVAPPGTVPVLVRSTEWYDVLARAALVVSNVELDRFYQPRAGQRVLQTFHGYPSKAMGLGLWESKNFSPRRLQRQLDNTARTWTWALTPTPAMDRYYRDNYRYDGAILHDGYPRDDALTGPDADGRRADARARLGLRDDQTAVLVAPTWRDDLATNFRSAETAGHLDVDRLAGLLGSGYAVLSRGHRFHDAAGSRGTVIDVGDYPEVNDLILAADAAVLDYSSMRFDLALAGVPMVFCVPDLEAYAGQARGFLYPFTDSAPGPLVESTEQVAAELADIEGLRTQWAQAMAEFNATYNDRQDGHAASRVVDGVLGEVGFAG